MTTHKIVNAHLIRLIEDINMQLKVDHDVLLGTESTILDIEVNRQLVRITKKLSI